MNFLGCVGAFLSSASTVCCPFRNLGFRLGTYMGAVSMYKRPHREAHLLTHIYSMEPLDVQLGTVRRVPPEALTIQGIDDMVPGVDRRLLIRLRILRGRGRASTPSPGVNGVNGGSQVGLFCLLLWSWSGTHRAGSDSAGGPPKCASRGE